MQEIQKLLEEHRDEKFARFQRKLIPAVAPERVIGVRTPLLRRMAKEIAKQDLCEAFLEECPHEFFEENQLHGFILSERKEFGRCIFELEKFLPYIDNWATCDQTSPKIFKKHRGELLDYIKKWIGSEHTYTVRFSINMLMQHFLDEDFKPEYLDMVASVRSEEYYVNMAVAWYMATALAKQWDSAVLYVEQKKLGTWVHNKTIQKAVESYRISDEKKRYLRAFKENKK
jgi:3-methyladenine DNA glycosylase AlkD